MRAFAEILLDVIGLGLLVAAAWITWGLGAGLAALGVASLVLAFRIEERRKAAR